MIKYVGYNIPRDSFRLYRSTIVRSDYKFFFIYIYLSKKLLKTRKLKSKTEWNSIAVENSIAHFCWKKMMTLSNIKCIGIEFFLYLRNNVTY